MAALVAMIQIVDEIMEDERLLFLRPHFVQFYIAVSFVGDTMA